MPVASSKGLCEAHSIRVQLHTSSKLLIQSPELADFQCWHQHFIWFISLPFSLVAALQNKRTNGSLSFRGIFSVYILLTLLTCG